jgi:hypothetical protein
MKSKSVSGVLACVAALGACAPSIPDPMGMATNAMVQGAAGDPQAEADALAAAFDEAVIAARLPGDEALSCDALMAEMSAISEDPGLQASIARLEALQAEQVDAAQGAVATGVGVTAGRAVLGASVAGTPGAMQTNMIASYIAMAIAAGQTAAAQPRGAAMRAEVMAMMPAMGRQMRLAELMEAQECAYLQEQ